MTSPRSPFGSPVEFAVTPIRLYAQALAAAHDGMAALVRAQLQALQGFWGFTLQPFQITGAPHAAPHPAAAPEVTAPAPAAESPRPRPAVVAQAAARPQLRVVPDQPAA